MTASVVTGNELVLNYGVAALSSGSGVFGTNIGIYAMRSVVSSVQVSSATLEGDGVRKASVSRLTGEQVTITCARNNPDFFALITGRTYSVTGSTPNRVGQMKKLATDAPYIALAVGLNDDDGLVNGRHEWWPRLKITDGSLELVNAIGTTSLDFGEVSITFDAFPDDYYVEGQASEVQSVDITGTPTGGTFTLSLGSETTSTIAFDAASAAVQSALEALANIGTGNATVSGSNPNFAVTFASALANKKMPLLVSDNALLTGGTAPDVTVTRDTAGSPGTQYFGSGWWDEQGTTPVIPPAL